MFAVSAVRVSPTGGVPPMVGLPVASRLGAAATATVASLVRVSSLSASSVKVTRTWMVFPCSLAVRVWVEPVAPEMSDPPAIHW